MKSAARFGDCVGGEYNIGDAAEQPVDGGVYAGDSGTVRRGVLRR